MRKAKKLPSSIEEGVLKYKKTLIWSNKINNGKKKFLDMIYMLKIQVCKIINHFSSKSKISIRFVTDKHWNILGLRFANRELRNIKNRKYKDVGVNQYMVSLKDSIRKSNRKKITKIDINCILNLQF